jgi:hypothetical protein
MKKLGIALGLMLAFAPSALAGPSPTASDKARAAQACAVIRAEIGSGAFKLLYAPNAERPRAAVRRCLASLANFEHQNRESPEWKQACEAMQPPPENPPTDANAYGECVSELAKAKSRENQEETISAAQQCKAERRDPAFAAEHAGQSFAQVYGTQNTNAKNAFARCVHQKKAAADEETTTP